MADLGEGPRQSPLFWAKKEEMTEGSLRKAGWASKVKPGPLLSSKSGSATEHDSCTTANGWQRHLQFILFSFSNYSPLIPMELKVSKGITCKWQNQRSLTNKCVSWALFLKLQAAGINFEKLLGWTVFKNPNFNPFQSSSGLSIRGTCRFCYVILTFL